MTSTADPATLTLVARAFDRITSNLAVLLNRSIVYDEVTADVVDSRVAGAGQVHLSFKLGLSKEGEHGQGCVLVPLPDAISLAGYLLMLPDSIVADARGHSDLDDDLKDAMLEVGNFVAGAINEALRSTGEGGATVRSDGCQGVRADVRPAFGYDEGSELLVGRARVRVHEFPEFEMILMLPAFAAA